MTDTKIASKAAPVRFEGVSKVFGKDVVAVDNIDLVVDAGKLVTLLGPSGCGKTTTLRMIAGLEMASSGRILIGERDVTKLPATDRDVSMVFQSYALFPHMNVEKNIAYGLKRDGLSKAEIATKVTDMLSLVQLDDYARRKPHQLSGGQKQRVALARALVKQPKLLLLDEPLGALDKKLREATQFELMTIQEELGITFIVVTHDQEEAMTLSTRLGVMHQGKLAQIGTPREVYEYPKSRLVADFIGTVNLFEGKIRKDEKDHASIMAGDLETEISLAHGIVGTLGQEVAFAIRPEKIQMSKKPLDLPNSLSLIHI